MGTILCGFLIILSLRGGHSTTNLEVNIIMLILGEDVNYGYFATGPMYDVALQRAGEKYPDIMANISVTVLHQSQDAADCAQAGAAMNNVAGKMFDLIDQKRGFPVLFSPGCSLEVAPLADFAREMDVLLITSTSADSSFANRKRYPTFVSFGPTGQGGHVPSLKRFLRLFSWTTVTVFCESLTNYLNVASFFGLICRGIKSLIMAASADEFTVFYEDFNSRSSKTNFRVMLERAKLQSRVIVIESREDVVQKIMIAAYQLNMTADEYVFIYPEPNRLPLYINLMDPTLDFVSETAKKAFLPLIVLNFDYPDWTKTRPIFEAVAETAKRKYNYTYRSDEMINDDSLAAYEATRAFFMVLHELTNGNQSPNLTLTNVRNQILNRTFDLDTRSVRIAPEAFRFTNIVYSRFNGSSAEFEPTWTYDSANSHFEVKSILSLDWNGQKHPPANNPICGYRGNLCPVQILQDQQLMPALACGVILALLLGGCMLFFWQYKQQSLELLSSWWLLKSEALLQGETNTWSF